MITRKTVMVLGAGASCSYGLPVGTELRKRILSIEPERLAKLPCEDGSAGYDPRQARAFLTAFLRSEHASIDAFLAHRMEFEQLGKYAIARILLDAENSTHLLEASPDDHWYRYLFRMMDAPVEEFSNNPISFITFNYDRSLEVSMLSMLQYRFGINAPRATSIVHSFSIEHVYGQLGSIDPSASDFVPYGGLSNDRSLVSAVRGLRILPEGREDSPEFQRARALLCDADAVCFLGFGFDKANVDRLGGHGISANIVVSERGHRGREFAASGYSLTQRERTAAADMVCAESRGAGNSVYDKKCLDTLRESLILQ